MLCFLHPVFFMLSKQWMCPQSLFFFSDAFEFRSGVFQDSNFFSFFKRSLALCFSLVKKQSCLLPGQPAFLFSLTSAICGRKAEWVR